MLFFIGCFDIIETFELSKDGIVKTVTRFSIMSDEKLGTKKNMDISDLRKNFKLKKSQTLTEFSFNDDFYSGFQVSFSSPVSDLISFSNLSRYFIFHPYTAGSNQFVFAFKNNNESFKTDSEEDKMGLAMLAPYKYRLFFNGEYLPKKAKLFSLSNNKDFEIKIQRFGKGVILEFPIIFLLGNSVLLVSSDKVLNENPIKGFIAQSRKEASDLKKSKELTKKKKEKEEEKNSLDEGKKNPDPEKAEEEKGDGDEN